MTVEQLKELITELGYEDVTVFDNCLGFDYADAFIGMSHDGRPVYSYDKMIEHIMLKEGWPYEEAVEWIDFNTIRAIPYAGERGPIVVYDVPEDMWPDDNDEPEVEIPEVVFPELTEEQIKNSLSMTVRQKMEEVLKVPTDRLNEKDDDNKSS